MEKWNSPSDYAGFNPIGDYVLYTKTRDSALITEHNWDEMVKAMNPGEAECFNAKRYPDIDDVTVPAVYTFRAGHWACGWVEYLMVRAEADDAIIEKAQALDDALEGYPILNEDGYYEKVAESVSSYWEAMSLRERIRTCVEYGLSMYAARRECGYSQDGADNTSLEEYIRSCVEE